MEKPYYNTEERLEIKINTTRGAFMVLKLAWLKFLRELTK